VRGAPKPGVLARIERETCSVGGSSVIAGCDVGDRRDPRETWENAALRRVRRIAVDPRRARTPARRPRGYGADMDSVELAFAGIAQQAELLRTRQVSSRELVGVYLERIERIDPALNAFREVFVRSALDDAAEADERIAAGESLPLSGVPVAFKDELDIAGKVTRHGTAGYDEPATANSVHVQRLLDAGAIALGTTNLPELAIYGMTESRTAGETRNPWDIDRTPGGSSGGSAAAVAAGLVGAASASDGAGSIRIPAACTGLVGLLPQRGRISLMPEAEHWFGLSRTGCLTRRVVDTALWLDVAAGPVPGDAHTPPPFAGSYVEAASQDPGRLRIGTSCATLPGVLPATVDDEARRGVEIAASALGDLGHQLSERDPDYGSVANDIVPTYLAGIAAHFSEVPHPERLEARTRSIARLGRRLRGRPLRRSLARQDEHRERINGVFDDVDVLVTPVMGGLPVEVGRWRNSGAVSTVLSMARAYPFTAVWNYTGQPAIAVPVGSTADGVPLSAMLVAPPGREDLLLSLAGQLERALQWADRRPPVD
jgi:amidase